MSISVKQKCKKIIFICSVILFLLGAAPSSVEDPINMLQRVTDRVMNELRTNRYAMRQDPNKIYAMVERLIVPYADFSEMAQWVVGRNTWNSMDAPTKARFIHEFTGLVVRSYARSLLEYTDQRIEFLPLRTPVGNKQRIQVASIIVGRATLPIHMDYRLIRIGNTWKVYDIIIEGVSLIQGYRAQFSDAIQQEGINAVIDKMRSRNEDNGGN